MTNRPHLHIWLLPSLSLLLLGAGCRSPSPPVSPNTASNVPGIVSNEAGNVPSDIPTYPGGFVIAVSGDKRNVHVAQSTPDGAGRVTDWIKAEYTRRGARLTKTSQEGSSTNLTFESAGNRYLARIDNPKDGGSAFLTISREPAE